MFFSVSTSERVIWWGDGGQARVGTCVYHGAVFQGAYLALAKPLCQQALFKAPPLNKEVQLDLLGW